MARLHGVKLFRRRKQRWLADHGIDLLRGHGRLVGKGVVEVNGAPPHRGSRRAGLLQRKQALLAVDLQQADLTAELNDLLGLPLGTSLMAMPAERVSLNIAPREETMQLAVAENPQLAAAAEKVGQAKAALTAAKSAYIPDVSVFARHGDQNGVAFLIHNFGTLGARPELRRLRFWQTPGGCSRARGAVGAG